MSGGNLCESHEFWRRRVVTVIAVVGATFTVASAQSAKPKADDVGITADEIRVAVIADVDTPDRSPACSSSRSTR